MKKTIFLILFCLLAFSSPAMAKISVGDYVVNDEQVYIIKGYLYNLTSRNAVVPNNLKAYAPHIVNSVVWIDEKQVSSQVFNLKTTNNNNSIIILNAIQNINSLTAGNLPQSIVEAVLASWNNLGSRVLIETTNQTLSLKLSPFSIYSTKHLVYRYNL